MATCSERLKSLLKASGASQIAVAEACDISGASMTRYLSDRVPKAQELYRLAKYFGVSMEWLLTGEEEGNGRLEPLVAKVSEQSVKYQAKKKHASEELRQIRAMLEKIERDLES